MNKLTASLLAGAALAAFSVPALAQNSPQANSDPKIGALEQQLRDLEQQLAEIKAAEAQNDPSAPLADLKRSTSDQYKDLYDRLNNRPAVRLDDGRLRSPAPTATSACHCAA